MFAADIPPAPGYKRLQFTLLDLLQRAGSTDQARWTDLPSESGVYVILWTQPYPPVFLARSGRALYANCTDSDTLDRRWRQIGRSCPTDILYVGKGDNIKKRVRFLARFGVGKGANHGGGEWVWQVQGIETARLLVQTCPPGRERGFENSLLERFFAAHGALPLANRLGPQGTDRWYPSLEN